METRLTYRFAAPEAEIILPASKSESNRLLVLNALSGDQTRLINLSEARDTRILAGALRELSGAKDPLEINCMDGGAPLRFLMAVAALLPVEVILTGTERLMERPMDTLIQLLRTLGAEIAPLGSQGKGPWKVKGGRLKGGRISVPPSESSQFTSALMLVAPFLTGGLELELKQATGSLSYLSMTVDALRRFGANVRWEGSSIRIREGINPPESIECECDWSAAAFPLLAADLAGMDSILFPGLRPDSGQGDRFLSTYIRYFAWKGKQSDKGVEFRRRRPEWPLRPYSLCLADCPDLAPPLVIHALLRQCEVDYYGLESLVFKESRRDEVLGTVVNSCGAAWHRGPGIWQLQPAEIKAPGILDTHQDHRMAMAFSLLSIPFGSVVLSEVESVVKSFPGFWEEMKKIGIGRTQ